MRSYKSFSDDIQENFLYSDAAGRLAFVDDKERVANAFFFNFSACWE
jgi:hypothetical protein